MRKKKQCTFEMRNYFTLANIATFFSVVYKTDAVHELVVVSPMAGSTMDFIRIRTLSPSSYVDGNERGELKEPDFSTDPSTLQHLRYPSDERDLTVEHDMRAKNEICAYIFNTALFDLRKEDVMDLTRMDVRQTLLESHPQIYEDIFGDREHIYTNPYTRRVIAVRRERVSEWTLRCLTRERDEPKELKEYFLSPIYNLISTGTMAEGGVRGRFIFERDRNSRTGLLSVFAIAEEASVVSASVIENTHQTYFAARKDTKYERPDPSTNIVCGMTTAQKIRLCNLVFSSSELRDKIRFWPSKDYIEPLCELERVITRIQVNLFGMKNIFYRQEVFNDVDLMYEEYMLGCKGVRTRRMQLRPSLYVSRGYEPHTAIVYKRDLQQNTYEAVIGLSDVSVITQTGSIRRVKPQPVLSKSRSRVRKHH